MPISGKVKALMNIKGKDHSGLAKHLGISAQALSNKFYRDSFSAADLIKISEYVECPLAFIVGDAQNIFLEKKHIEK